VSHDLLTFDQKRLLDDNIGWPPQHSLDRLVQIASNLIGQTWANWSVKSEFDIAMMNTPTPLETKVYVNIVIARVRDGLKNKTLPDVIKDLETGEQLLIREKSDPK